MSDDVNELIKLAKTDAAIDYKRHGEVGRFARELDIERSENRISAEIIYLLYFRWAKSKHRIPKNKRQFYTTFNKMFSPYKGYGLNYYYVQSDKLNLEEKEKWELRRSVELSISQRKRYSNGKKEKRQSKISGTKESV